jgi:predicted metal-dependent hydrolase
VHELLETVWLSTAGNERKALRGLIQAAGVFVHRGRNHHKAAQGLARRAMKSLEAASPYLGFIEDLAPLIASLKDATAKPPILNPGSPPML